MFAGRSEIFINVTVNHLQHIEIIWVCSFPGADLLRFLVTRGTEKTAKFWFARGSQYAD